MEAEESGSGDLVEEFAREQPFLMTFLVTAEEEIEKMDDRGFLILYGMWAWLAFKYNGRTGTIVPASAIEAARNANIHEMETLHGVGDNAVDRAGRKLTKSYRQAPLLGAILNNVAEGEMESEHRQDDITGLLLVEIKTVIDALDATP